MESISADIEGANISGSEGGSNLIGDSQARGDPAGESQPDHLGHPKSHAPWHCHRFVSRVCFAFLSRLFARELYSCVVHPYE